MNFTIISPGKFSDQSQKLIYNEYSKRLKWKINLKEINSKSSSSLGAKEVKDLEADLIVKNISSNSYIIAMDERGKQIGSIDFANLIKEISLGGNSNVDLIIGGAFGLSDKILNRACYKLSLGKMTFPHLMVRLMLIEQIYRAQTIIDGHPYHKP